jgi:acyl-coenzyme A synthetase/AMP-(fatty) acid ligase
VRDGKIYLHQCNGGAINVAGRKVSPERLRAILESIPGVLAAVVERGSSRDFERFEEIRVYVRIADGIDSKEVRESFRRETESWEMPRKWEFRV